MKADGIDALLFDLGRVVIDIDFNRAFARWAKHASCDEALIRDRFVRDAAFNRHEVGELSDDAYFASVRTSLGIDITNAELLDGWNAIFVGEMQGISDVLRRVAAEDPGLRFLEFQPGARGLLVEAVRQRSQPFQGNLRVVHDWPAENRTPRLTSYVVKAIGVPSERILFFDDNAENIAGARRCGLQAVHVTSSSDVANALAGLAL